ncbi:alcohol dehydrogenase [Cupriavidus necator]|uniref:iron-containing alcohol dehydrogenase n=1 Tax=Cupriavidus necator TaxID=106590 RepID=UPI0007355B10|nr:iron-containing alcohol dehydrogenase [Cupriavidus necator]KUE88028.1 alcohol dehydrogenase [Cupriavidus necator]
MSQFDFHTTPKITCQRGAIRHLGTLAREHGMRHAFLVTDGGLHKAGLTTSAIEALRDASVEVTVYADVLADPPEATIINAADSARQAGADGVIGFGGGSSLDTAKLVALLARTPQAMDEIYGVGLARGPRLPLIQIPTTAGTGSEVTPISVVTTPTHEKKPIVAGLLLPDLALLDCELTVGLPPAVTAMTGVDAMVHAIETLTTHLKKNPLSDALAIEALKMLYRNLPLGIHDGKNLDVREQMLLGSLFAGMAFANSSVGAVHALAYPLGVHYHVPHGLSNSLMLPHVLRFNLESASAIYARMGRALLPELESTTDTYAARNFVDAICKLVSDMPYAHSLREVKVRGEDIPMLARDVMNIRRLLVHNPREIEYDQALALYEAAY